MRSATKGLAGSAAIYLFGFVIARISGLLLIPVYTNYLSPDEYGILGYVTALAAFVSSLAVLGLDGTVLRFYFDLQDNREELGTFLATVYVTVICSSLAVFLSIEAIAAVEPSMFSSVIPYAPYIRLGLLVSLLAIIPGLTLNYYRARQQPIRYITCSLLSFALTTILVLYLVVVEERGVLGSLEGSLIASIAMCIICVYDLRKEFNYRISRRHLREALRYGLPLVPGAAAGWVMLSSGRLFMGRYTPLHELGLYNFAFSLAGALLLVAVAFNSAWYPFVFKNMNGVDGPIIISRAMSCYMLGLTSLTLFLNGLGCDVIRLVAARPFWGSCEVVPILILACFCHALYYLPGSMLLYHKRTRIQASMAVVVASFSLILNAVLIPKAGMVGAAWSFLLTYFGLAAAAYFVAEKYVKIPYEYRRLGKLFGVFICSYIAISFLEQAGWNHILVMKLGILMTFPAWLYTVGYFSDHDKQFLLGIVKYSWGFIRRLPAG